MTESETVFFVETKGCRIRKIASAALARIAVQAFTMTTPEEMAASALAGFNEHTSPSPGLPKVAPAGVQGISPVLQKDEKSATKKTRKKGPRQKTKIVFPVEPRVIQTIPKRKDYVNHS
jgi:hypothetical protein